MKVTEEMFEFVSNCSIGWRKLFEQAQDILREIRKEELLPEDLYVKAVRICNIERLPIRYLKKERSKS